MTEYVKKFIESGIEILEKDPVKFFKGATRDLDSDEQEELVYRICPLSKELEAAKDEAIKQYLVKEINSLWIDINLDEFCNGINFGDGVLGVQGARLIDYVIEAMSDVSPDDVTLELINNDYVIVVKD